MVIHEKQPSSQKNLNQWPYDDAYGKSYDDTYEEDWKDKKFLIW